EKLLSFCLWGDGCAAASVTARPFAPKTAHCLRAVFWRLASCYGWMAFSFCPISSHESWLNSEKPTPCKAIVLPWYKG
ncbi:hypothetical protein EN829_060795, partial [Mesorhizobium sp. M00.F.Ca.ET.186.01.1.1]